MNATATEDRTDVVEDEEIIVPESTPFLTIPAGVYTAALVGFKTVDKPAWKVAQQRAQAEKQDQEIDNQQWRWVFRVTEGDYAGTELQDFTNRSWHENAKAHKHAAALLGVPTLTPGVALSTRALAGKLCQVWVNEVESKKEAGQFRNYVDKCVAMPTPRMRPQKPQNGAQAHTGATVQLPGYPAPDDDIPFGPEDGA